MTPFESDAERKAAFAKKAIPKVPKTKPSLSATSRKTTKQAEVQAQLRHDSWLLRELQRRDPDAYHRLTTEHPLARQNLVGSQPESWSMDESEDTEALLKEVEAALYARANTLPDPARSRLLSDLTNRESLLRHQKRLLNMPPARLRKELAELQRAYNWTSPRFLRERLQLKRLITSTKRELQRRGLQE